MHSTTPLPTDRCARRMIDLRRPDERTVIGWLEDDFHHFGVTIQHRNGMVKAIRMAAPRHPWATCPGAAVPLQALIGKPLIERASDIGTLLDMRLQCTHVFDLTGLALAHATQQRDHLRYQCITTDRQLPQDFDRNAPKLGVARSILLANDEVVLAWHIDNDQIIAPAAHAGHSLNEGFRAWTEAMPLDEAEHAFILRRAIMVAGGRLIDHDQFSNAAGMGMPALCHSFQPGVRDVAWREKGQTRNYEKSATDMLLNVEQVP